MDGKHLKKGLTKSHGDVDCIGFEPGPSLKDRQNAHSRDLATSNSIKQIADVPALRDIVCSKFKSLRIMKQQCQKSVSSKIRKVGDDWQNSKEAFSIDTLRTQIHSVDTALNEGIIAMTSITKIHHQSLHLHPDWESESCDLSIQQNFVTLKEENQTNFFGPVAPHHVKQGSEEWFEIRKGLTTGSRFRKAIGLDGVQEMASEYHRIFHGIQTPIQVNEAMAWGLASEKHAVATMTSVVMPQLFQDLIFHEEGIHISDGIGASPDGSLRKECGSTILYAVEIKCPTTNREKQEVKLPVDYEVPCRYMTQILLEGRNTHASQGTLYVCWTTSTTSVILVPRDHELELEMVSLLKDLYSQNVCPSKLHPGLKNLKKKLEGHVNKCTFLGEFPSVHARSEAARRESGINDAIDAWLLAREFPISNPHLQTFDNLQNDCNRFLKTAYKLSRSPATQVFAVVGADLLRNPSGEDSHAVLLGYLLRGGSMPMKNIRNIREHVRQKVFEQGVHSPVLCSDGEFYPLMSRDDNGVPLSTYQLARTHFKNCQKIKRETILKEICHSNSVSGYTLVIIEKLDGTRSIEFERKTGTPLPLKSPLKGWKKKMTTKTPNKAIKPAENGPTEQGTITPETSLATFTLSTPDYAAICSELVSQDHAKWKQVRQQDIEDVLKSGDQTRLTKFFRVCDLKVVARYINCRLKAQIKGSNLVIQLSLPKPQLCKKIADILSLGSPHSQKSTHSVEQQSKTNGQVGPVNPKSLHDIAWSVIKSKVFPLDILRAAYARSTFESSLGSWPEKTPHIPSIVQVQTDHGKVDWIPSYRPTICQARNQIEIGKKFSKIDMNMQT